ncbi:MAG: site-specific integrase [Ktedonobacteraceae bacterium]
MAIGEKRADAKAQASLRGESLTAFTDGKIHSFESRATYQQVVMRFIEWCRQEHDLRDLARIDAQADVLVSAYLSERIAAGYSAWTLQTERSALRTFFGSRDLAGSVELPRRTRTRITRSRLPAKRDRHINLDNWRHVIDFCLACGLRREELRDLYVCEVTYRLDGQLVVCVRNGKGGKARTVPVFPGREQAILSQVEGRPPDAHIFVRISSLLDIHSYRRQFAQELYIALSGRPLPVVEGRLRSQDLDWDRALYVSRCLGHNRVAILCSSYLR